MDEGKLTNWVKAELNVTLTQNVKVLTEVKPLNHIVMRYVLRALKTKEWNRTHAAKALGISLRTLRNYIKTMRNQGIGIPSGPMGATCRRKA